MRTAPITILLLSSLILSSCCSSKEELKTGEIRGVLEQVLHHGAAPSDGDIPTTSLSPLSGASVTISSEDGEVSMESRTSMTGEFSARLAVGRYIVSVQELSDEVPGSTPKPREVVVVADSTIEITFQYHIYAP